MSSFLESETHNDTKKKETNVHNTEKKANIKETTARANRFNQLYHFQFQVIRVGDTHWLSQIASTEWRGSFHRPQGPDDANQCTHDERCYSYKPIGLLVTSVTHLVRQRSIRWWRSWISAGSWGGRCCWCGVGWWRCIVGIVTSTAIGIPPCGHDG